MHKKDRQPTVEGRPTVTGRPSLVRYGGRAVGGKHEQGGAPDVVVAEQAGKRNGADSEESTPL
ncbi:hypothetical protein Acsp01_15150 [Actinoplanes sp. NBRC 101535]|nr:hypothetical protein Acsp01_15150 [Actinoplanes sp. NBRC 101535]